jgi:hypothetical protein
MFIDSRLAFDNVQVAAMFTAIPISATMRTAVPGDHWECDQPGDALIDDQQFEHQERGAVELGREDLGALEAEGHGALGGALGEADREQREADRGGVGEHVCGI